MRPRWKIHVVLCGGLLAVILASSAIGTAQVDGPTPWANDLLQMAKLRAEPSHTATDLIAAWEWGKEWPQHRAEAHRIFTASALVQQAMKAAGAPTFDTYVKMHASQGVDQREMVRVAAWAAAAEFHFKERLSEAGAGSLDCAAMAAAFDGTAGIQRGRAKPGMPTAGFAPRNEGGRHRDRGGAQGGRVVSGIPMCGGSESGGADIPASCFPGSPGMFGMCALPSTSKLTNVPGFGGGGNAAMGGLGSTVDPEKVGPPGPKWQVQDACTALNPKAVMGGGGAMLGGVGGGGTPQPTPQPGGGDSGGPSKQEPKKDDTPPSPTESSRRSAVRAGVSPSPNRDRSTAPERSTAPRPKRVPAPYPEKADVGDGNSGSSKVKITPKKVSPKRSDILKSPKTSRPTDDGNVGAAHEACGQSVVQAMFGCMFPSVGPSGGGGGGDYLSAPAVGGGATVAPEGDRMSCLPGGAKMSPGIPAPESVMSCTCGGFGSEAGMGSGGSFSQNSLEDLCSQFGHSPRWANHCGAYDPNPTQLQLAPNPMQPQQGRTQQRPNHRR